MIRVFPLDPRVHFVDADTVVLGDKLAVGVDNMSGKVGDDAEAVTPDYHYQHCTVCATLREKGVWEKPSRGCVDATTGSQSTIVTRHCIFSIPKSYPPRAIAVYKQWTP
jgi:hypothetical protein